MLIFREVAHTLYVKKIIRQAITIGSEHRRYGKTEYQLLGIF
jgi:hypothetical protein